MANEQAGSGTGSRKSRGRRGGAQQRRGARRVSEARTDEGHPRRSATPPPPLSITYPAGLPVSEQRADIQKAIRENQVVIVAGETGSGKTTQLPKMLLEMGYGAGGRLIGHTQPRRIAARSVASRIAQELGERLGEGTVGYQVRFTKQTAKGARLKVMTDGILLSEVHRDRRLAAYDAIIIDEAHERSLTIDMLLGYLKRITAERPDLKVIITSATIDPERFAEFFAHTDAAGVKHPAPIVEVSGRTYPVEVRYRPLVLDAELDGAEGEDADLRSVERDLTEAIIAAADELMAEGPGDILVFLPGEREIREVSDALEAHLERGKRPGASVSVLPLFGRLSEQDQQKIFTPPRGSSERRIILATNVAETSLTVPGIRYVIDSGLARISRYSQRTKVQRLPIEEISQASAKQRSGRSGRTSPGIAIRLYSEQDFEARPAFTEPEILRTSLASVVLQMTALGLGDIESFEFVEPPDQRAVRDGVRLLEELGAIREDRRAPGGRRLTDIGEQISRFPLEPRMARMLIEASARGALREALVIVAALSIPDPRERPLEAQARAQQLHARFAHERSDFLTFLNLWNHLRERRDDLSNSAFKREVKGEFLHYMRIREWWDLHAQLREMCRDADLSQNDTPASESAIHQSLLAGLLSHVGLYDERTRDYQGARGSRFVIWPGSVLAKKKTDYVMVAELVETSRLFGRIAAAIDPAWIEDVGDHVLKRSYSEPHWSSKRAAAMAYEKVTLYGVPIVARRAVAYGRINPEVSRELFIQHALVEGQWSTRHHFARDNARLMNELEELENKARRRDLIVGDDALMAFYDERIPASVTSGRHFDAWWKKERHERPDLLTLTREILLADGAEPAAQGFPDTWVQGDITLALTYAFEPAGRAGEASATQGHHDGVTATVPLAVLGRLRPTGFDWLVPGMREEKIAELIRSLPKPLRRHLIPAPDKAKAVARVLHDEDVNSGEAFVEAVADELVALPDVPDDLELYGSEFDTSRLSPHLHMHFSIVDDRGRQIGHGDDLAALQRAHRSRMETSAARQAESFGEKDFEDFPEVEIPRSKRRRSGGLNVVVYPSLKTRREKDAVAVDLTALPSAQDQEREHPPAVVALVERHMRAEIGDVLRSLPNPTKLALSQSTYGGAAPLLRDASLAATMDLTARTEQRGMVFTRPDFDALVAHVGQGHADLTRSLVLAALDALAAHARLGRALSKVTSLSVLQQLTQIRDHAARLVGERFVSTTPAHIVPHLPRYLAAAQHRLEKMQDNPARDAQLAWQIQDLEQWWASVKAGLSPEVARTDAAREIDWMIEELRVSLFAQQLGTRMTISDKRVRAAIADLTR
ncbi:MAG: ATP-dependent RNA helicase HrpA [Dermabacter sp.]|nr:ATP-dependent RNA helicase HrpA [Dermabacter sp.]